MASTGFKRFVEKLGTKYLFVSNVVGGSGLLLTGDLLEQTISHYRTKKEDDKLKYNWTRAGKVYLSGALTMFPMAHFWYKFIDGKFPGKQLKTVLKKTALDTMVGVPVINMPWMFAVGLLEGESPERSFNNCITNFIPVLLGDVLFVTPCQFLNFRFVPPKYRVLVLACIGVVWTTYLSFLKHSHGDSVYTDAASNQPQKSDENNNVQGEQISSAANTVVVAENKKEL